MNDEQRNNHLLSLVEKLKIYGLRVHKLLPLGATVITKDNNCNYLDFQLRDDGSLVLVQETYLVDANKKIYAFTGTNMKIDEPHYENLIQIAELYFGYGRGNNPNNPTLEELLNITKCQTKSARAI